VLRNDPEDNQASINGEAESSRPSAQPTEGPKTSRETVSGRESDSQVFGIAADEIVHKNPNDEPKADKRAGMIFGLVAKDDDEDTSSEPSDSDDGCGDLDSEESRSEHALNPSNVKGSAQVRNLRKLTIAAKQAGNQAGISEAEQLKILETQRKFERLERQQKQRGFRAPSRGRSGLRVEVKPRASRKPALPAFLYQT